MFANKLFAARFAAVATLWGASLAAHADILAGVGFGGPRQSQAVCYLFNAGPGAVNITSKSIHPEFGNTLPTLVYDTCANSLAAGNVCAFVANIPSTGGNACRVVLTPSGANVRGTLEIRDSSGEVLNSMGLR
jgi:hypothetical protein